jgi:hypothetical protein
VDVSVVFFGLGAFGVLTTFFSSFPYPHDFLLKFPVLAMLSCYSWPLSSSLSFLLSISFYISVLLLGLLSTMGSISLAMRFPSVFKFACFDP